MSTKQDYTPMTRPLSRAERIADAIVVGVLIFWFGFLGMVPQRSARGVPGVDDRKPDGAFTDEGLFADTEDDLETAA